MDTITGTKVACVTIADSRYFPQVLVLAESFRKFNSESEFYFVCLDDFTQVEKIEARISIISVNELGIPSEVMRDLNDYYDVVELATALKPWAILKLLESNNEVVIYLDPDILVTNTLEKCVNHALQFGVVLTPARVKLSDSNVPDEDELRLLRYGSFNLGFIACSIEAREILLWWQKRLIWYSSRAKFHFHFTDQKWMDLLPSVKDIGILRDFGYNLTVANLNERELSFREGQILANEDPLAFVHFIQSSEKLKRRHSANLVPLSERSNSIEIYDFLTQEYVNRLNVANARLKEISMVGFKVRYKSIWIREYLRNRSLKAIRTSSTKKMFRDLRVLRLASHILVPFEKSFAFQFAIAGFLDDVNRMRIKLKAKVSTK